MAQDSNGQSQDDKDQEQPQKPVGKPGSNGT